MFSGAHKLAARRWKQDVGRSDLERYNLGALKPDTAWHTVKANAYATFEVVSIMERVRLHFLSQLLSSLDCSSRHHPSKRRPKYD